MMRDMRILACFLTGIAIFGQISSVVGQNLSALVVDVSDMGDGSISQARLEAQRQARSGGLPFRSFRRGQIRNFVGRYTPPELPEDKKDRFIYGLALFSDDGCNVTLKGSSVHARFGRGQHLPNLGQSFHVLPVALAPGETVDITINYRNTIYAVLPGQPPDIDGLTLFLYLIPAAIAVDANRDGNIVFQGDSRDITSRDKPFRFWINDDHDGIPNDERDVVPPAENDYADGTMQTMRDLEDFARLYLDIGGLQERIADGTLKIGLKFSDASESATINLYKSTDPDGSTSYLTDDEAALAQVSGADVQALGQVTSEDPLILPPDFFTRSGEQSSTKCLLFEGSGEGKGQLVLTIHKADGTKIGEGGSCWLDLMNIKKMYERATAIPEFIRSPHDYILEYPPDPQITYDGEAFEPAADEAKQVIVFVHGINGPGGGGAAESYNGWVNVSETIFKRLWHQGYKGRFAFFKWPALTPAFPFQYNDSEYRAFKSGRGLAHFLASFPRDYRKSLYSFSQGAVVCGAALTVYNGAVDNYVLSQAAIPAGCYDASDSINNYDLFDQREQQSPTPDTAAELGYRGYLSGLNVSGSVVSFYNTVDYALKTGQEAGISVSWEGNQLGYKPNAFTGRSYKYDADVWLGGSGRVAMLLINDSIMGRYVADIHESMSFVARPRSDAAGANESVGGSIGELYNVGPGSPSAFDRESSDHGGQFSRRIQQLWPYYRELGVRLRVLNIQQ
jgi:hypothetical protein